MNYIKFFRIFLLVLIIIGLGLLLTQRIWVPKVVDMIIKNERTEQLTPIVSETKNIKINSFESCMQNGGKDLTSNYNAPKKCVVNNHIYEDGCVSNSNYFVISEGNPYGVGSNILVKYKSSPSQNFECKYVVNKGDFEIRNEQAEYIEALENNFLILDSGTGPDPRKLIIYDLNTKKKIHEDSYSKPITIQNNIISYWTGTTTKVTEKNCPDFKTWKEGGLGVAIDEYVSLNLSTLRKTELGEYHCSPRQ